MFTSPVLQDADLLFFAKATSFLFRFGSSTTKSTFLTHPFFQVQAMSVIALGMETYHNDFPESLVKASVPSHGPKMIKPVVIRQINSGELVAAQKKIKGLGSLLSP
ncbi:MAG: hypothetical protein ACON4R_05460 [Akkermansiaceae bacterium]